MPGDRIVEVAGFEIGTFQDLHHLLDSVNGHTVSVTAMRDGERLTGTVGLLDRPERKETVPLRAKTATLHTTVAEGLTSVVQVLVAAGAKVDTWDEYGDTPLPPPHTKVTSG